MSAQLWIHLAEGFALALQPENLLFAAIGVFLGTVVGVLPGIGPAGAVAMVLPLVFKLNPVSSIIMLASLYSGAMYGGSTTSILLNVPGESSSVVTCLDGYQMAKQGRAGPALCIAAIGSYIAGTLGVVGLMLFGPGLARLALKFGPPEYFALMLFGLSAVSSLASGSLIKGVMAMILGLIISTVGMDTTGVLRFTFGRADLFGGIELLSLSIGLFAISEILVLIREHHTGAAKEILSHKLFLSFKDFLDSIGAILRGSVVGFLIGILPGAGAGIASFISYSLEIQISRQPEKFGKGEIRGVAAPESANNAASVGALVTMLTLGIPGSATTAIMLGALMSLDVQTGPLIFSAHPDVVYGLVAALYLGNIMLVILNLPLVGIFVRLLRVPLKYLITFILMLSIIGVYSANQNVVDLVFMCAFGVLGYLMRRHGYPLAPVILGFVLGGRMEDALRQSMIMSQGNPIILFSRPISILFYILALFFILLPFILRYITGKEAEEIIDQEG